ncbi:MAG: E3 ubiquitin ligase family protein, partial [Actinomycetota bacterium]|nr:E3 ubiquitin ligase family protein [Actinomycetota bacterium]
MVVFLILLLFAIIFLVAGGVMLYIRRRTQQKAGLMSQTQTSNASEVSSLAPGTLVEVKGTLRCEEPLTSEMAGHTCAYYAATVTREYLERDYDDDDVGSDRRSEIISQNTLFAPFSVEDSTGSVPVNAEGAEVDARQVMNRFERNTGNDRPSISLGGATLNLGGGERTIGYRYTESILPVDAPVYVLGTVQESGEIGPPPSDEAGHRFVVSHRSEGALFRSLGKTVMWLGVGAIGAFVLGVVLLA